MRSLWLEKLVRGFFFLCAFSAVMITIGIVASLIGEALRFFARVSVFDFSLGLPGPLIPFPRRSVRFGAIALFTGTALITLIAMTVAIPCGTMIAIYLSEYASPRKRQLFKPLLETLAGIPTLIYGFFAATTFGPFLREWQAFFTFPLRVKVL